MLFFSLIMIPETNQHFWIVCTSDLCWENYREIYKYVERMLSFNFFFFLKSTYIFFFNFRSWFWKWRTRIFVEGCSCNCWFGKTIISGRRVWTRTRKSWWSACTGKTFSKIIIKDKKKYKYKICQNVWGFFRILGADL